MSDKPSDWAVAPKFGEWLRGIYASERNPLRDGMYVRTIRRTGRCNPGTYYELTDGKGNFWQYPRESVIRLDRARELDASAKCDCGCGRSVCPACGEDLGFATPRAAEAATTNSAQISSSLVVGDVGEDTRCRHDNGRPGYDLWHCSDCGAVKTDSGWGIAKHRYFNDRAEAEFFRKHGRLPDDGKPQPWGNAAMGAVGAGD